ncbi:MAG: Holliday junction resolvase RuvX [Verrucomicrobiota bacterium]|nr:Holliday junction resolvase RuvX [Verrucomicrobiota bacterium]MEC7638271.1 Holliday junction resolvase RuvX [Verrucomicrobiota bacterium]MEC8659361.1 Holliday junction resolvase RuvX [Verrucomicrobiota bacterium]MEC8690694.1 Holliday junction resolvase RuvX [Verrucomicrobiota bacterium]
MKVIGIDYGEVRIGVSCSDDLGMFAHPLETIHVKKIDPIKRIIEIAEEKKIQAVVIGMPRNLDGSYGSAAKKVESFLKKIKTVLPEVQVFEQDERFTTTVAQKKLQDTGHTVKSSRQIIDEVAAVEILQSFLDQNGEYST